MRAHRGEDPVGAVQRSEPANDRAMRSSGRRERHDAAAVDGGRDLSRPSRCSRFPRAAPAGADGRRGGSPGSPSARPADGEKTRVLPGAVVVDRPGGRPSCSPHSRSSSVAGACASSAAHGLELRRLGAVRRAGDRDLPVVEIGREGRAERLDRLGAGAKRQMSADSRGSDHSPSRTATACTRWRASVAPPRRTDTLSGLNHGEETQALWPHGGLWRHPDFLKLWSGQTISQVGSQVRRWRCPWRRCSSSTQARSRSRFWEPSSSCPFCSSRCRPASGWTGCAVVHPHRHGPCRGLFLASIPVAYLFDALTIWQLYVVGFLVGICTVFFDVSSSRISLRSCARTSSWRELAARGFAQRGPDRRARSPGCSSAPSRPRTPFSSTLSASSGRRLLGRDSHGGRARR